MPDAGLIPRKYDAPEWVRAALLDYEVFLNAQSEVWALWHEQHGAAAPAARSLAAEACIVSLGLFRDFYEGLQLRLARLFHAQPEAAINARLN